MKQMQCPSLLHLGCGMAPISTVSLALQSAADVKCPALAVIVPCKLCLGMESQKLPYPTGPVHLALPKVDRSSRMGDTK